MASSENAGQDQVKEVETKLNSVWLNPRLQGEGANSSVEGKVRTLCAEKPGNDALVEDMPDVVDDGTTSVTETTHLHGNPLSDSQMHRNNNINPDLHVGRDNCVDGTNTAIVVAVDKDVCDTPSDAAVQVHGHQVSVCTDLGRKEVQQEENNKNDIEKDLREHFSTVRKLEDKSEEVSSSIAREEYLEDNTILSYESGEEKHTGDARTYMMICWENEEIDGAGLKSEKVCSGLVNDNGGTDHSAKTGPLFVDENVHFETNNRNLLVKTEAEQPDLETKKSPSVIVKDNGQRVGKRDGRVIRETTKREFKDKGTTAGEGKLKSCNNQEFDTKNLNSDDQMKKYSACETECMRTENTQKASTSKNVRLKPSKNTLSLPTKKSSKIKMEKTLRLLPGLSYNELFRKAQEKSWEKGNIVEEQKHVQTKKGSQETEIGSSQRKRWTRRGKQTNGMEDMCGNLAQVEHREKSTRFDDGSLDEAECTVKQKSKGRKKKKENKTKSDDSFQECLFENDTDEQDYGYSTRYVYYGTGERNQDIYTLKQEQPIQDYDYRYYQKLEEDEISDHFYRGHRCHGRGRGEERGTKYGTREFRRSKSERSVPGNQVSQSSRETFAKDFRRSSSSVSESSTQSGSMLREGVDRSREDGQCFLNLTITASGDGTRHVESAEKVGDFVRGVNSGAGKEGKKRKKNKRKQTRQQEGFLEGQDERYRSFAREDEEQAAGGCGEDIEYQDSEEKTVKLKPNQSGRHRNRNSNSFQLKRHVTKTDKKAVKGDYSKLLQQCNQFEDANYLDSFGESSESPMFDSSQRQWPTKKQRQKQRHPDNLNADDSLADEYTIAEANTQEELETNQDASVGHQSSEGKGKNYRQSGGERGHPHSGSLCQDGGGGGDGHEVEGRKTKVQRGGQNLKNPYVSQRTPTQGLGPRQTHTSHEFSQQPRKQRRGGSGRHGSHSDRGCSPIQQHQLQGATGYSPPKNYIGDGHRCGGAKHSHQQNAHIGGQTNREGQQSNEGGHKNKRHHRKHKEKYESYWSTEDISAGLKRRTLIEGPIRVNPRNYNEAYVPLPDGTADVFISGLINRNRALNGDIVAVQILERENWKVFVEDLEEREAKIKQDNDGGEHDEDSGPDVVVEGIEVVSSELRNEQQREKQKRRTPLTRRTYTSVKEVVSGGSPMAKSLMESTGAGAGDMERVGIQGLLQKTGKVVAVLETKHSRACSGHIRLMQDKNKDVALFSPTDSRVPRIQIARKDCPKDFFERSDDYAKTIFIARITEWDENSMFAKGHLARSLGEAGQIEPETDAILIEHNVEFDEFPEEVLKCLPQNLPWTIPPKEFEYRRDLRQQCIFTIDPSTARDLDDAMSIEVLEDGKYEVGVHIADVSFFLEESTPLDVKAAGRATSVYLVQKVIPMLPRLLCEELCSLNPDEDRLCFSVIWKMDGNGVIEEEWFGRTVIRSCVKLSYDHAQGFIMEPDREWRAEELPPISAGVSVNDIKKRVLQLNKIANCLRKKRFDSGALRLDQVKLSFSLDSETGMPNGYYVYEQKDSNRLIEEFMLLANMAVAHRIYDKYPEKALLRRHPAPQNKMVDDLKDLCEQLGLTLDLSNSQTWQQSLNNYSGTDEFSAARMQVLVALSSKPMQNAKYFCSGMIDDPEVYRHYALNVPLYTHFTSPIRRYADVMVHRLLAASLGYSELTSKECHQLHKQAEHCNDKKYMSKRVQEMSSELFLAAFVREAGPFEEKAMVMGVMDHSFDVFILKFGVAKRVYCDQLDLKSKMYVRVNKKPELTLVWKSNSAHEEITQTITIFTSVIIFMMQDKDPLKWKVLLKQPIST